jgi:hypothetical protein
MFSLDELAEMEFRTQEALWYAYEQAPDDLKAMGWIKPPEGDRLTLEQFRARIANRAAGANRFRIKDASYRSFQRRN